MVEEGKYSSFWFIVRFLGLLLCQIFELLERKYQQYYSHSVTSTTTAINSNKDDSHSRQDDYDLNIIQFIQLNSYQISFSYKRSFGSWLWNSFASSYLKIQQLYSSNCQQNKMKFLELRISNDVQSLYHDIDKNFLSKIFSKNILLDWYHDLMNVSPKFSQVTIGIDNLDMVCPLDCVISF